MGIVGVRTLLANAADPNAVAWRGDGALDTPFISATTRSSRCSWRRTPRCAHTPATPISIASPRPFNVREGPETRAAYHSLRLARMAIGVVGVLSRFSCIQPGEPYIEPTAHS